MNGDDTPQPPEDADRTVFSPQLPPAAPASGAMWAADAPPEAQSSLPSAPPAATAPSQPKQVKVGDVLNHIFEVKRFIARGGMGEVFEGINVNSDERVAIKVILPNLAADPNVQAMFRKEARTLTRLSHPALVQYRVLAQEPVLGVFYIVTEYIDGKNLSDILREMDPTPQQLSALTKKLAEGLNAAHALGAIHRDISPDNVMLEGGTLAGAKVIDFGIAKDLDPGSATIVGDGFAGKLNYVAPEQLGDFGREVGPWTDVYSLALVILAIALKRDVDMGGSLVDAVDKRRAGPDLNAIPDELRPVIAKMLAPNPADRVRSMNEVVELLARPSSERRSVTRAPAVDAAPKPPPPLKPPVTPGSDEKSWVARNIPLVAGGGVGLVVLVAAGIYFGSGSSSEPANAVAPKTETVAAPAAPATDPLVAARRALDAGLPSVGCTWLDVASISPGDGGPTIAMRGVAGRPAEAQGQIGKLLAAAGVPSANIDFADVSPIEASECGPLEAFRAIRNPGGGAIKAAQRSYEMSILPPDSDEAGKLGARSVTNFNLSDSTRQYALFGIEPSGQITQVAKSTDDLAGFATGPNQYRLPIDVTHKGWSGFLVLSGRKPMNATFVAGPPGSHGPDWARRFSAAAAQGGWKAEMEWFKTVDDVPN